MKTIRIGTVVEVIDRFLSVEIYHTGQVIENVVKASPLNLDEREQKPNIKIGTEVMLLEDNYGVVYAINSLSQGIDLIKEKVSRIENDTIALFGDTIKVMNSVGDNSETEELIAEKVDVYTEKIIIRNEEDDVIQIMLDFMDAVIDLQTIVISGSSAGLYFHTQILTVLEIKARLEAFKTEESEPIDYSS